MTPATLEAQSLAKIYDIVPVFSGVAMKLEHGQGAFVIGRNGVGKSTLIKILAGLVRPTSGRALIFGQESCRLAPEQRRRIGVLLHQSMLYPNLTANENLRFYADLYGLGEARVRIGEWLERVGLSAAAHKRVRAFSRGMEQRLSIARAMLTDPDLLMFDEPFAALDGDGVALVKGLIRESIARGCAVLISAHAPIELGDLQFDMHELVGGRLVVSGEAKRPARLRSLSAG